MKRGALVFGDFFKLIVGLALAPTAAASVWAAIRTMGSVTSHAQRTSPFIIGFFGYLALRLFFIRPVRVYVLGHELSHALAAWLTGASVHGFHVGKNGGHVDLSHSNTWIALAPYVFPIYTVISVLIYRFIVWYSPGAGAHGTAYACFLAAVGLTLSFHFAHTAEAVGTADQPDLRQAGGTVFSLAVIALANGLILIVAAKALFPAYVGFERTLAQVAWLTRAFWVKAGHFVATAWPVHRQNL